MKNKNTLISKLIVTTFLGALVAQTFLSALPAHAKALCSTLTAPRIILTVKDTQTGKTIKTINSAEILRYPQADPVHAKVSDTINVTKGRSLTFSYFVEAEPSSSHFVTYPYNHNLQLFGGTLLGGARTYVSDALDANTNFISSVVQYCESDTEPPDINFNLNIKTREPAAAPSMSCELVSAGDSYIRVGSSDENLSVRFSVKNTSALGNAKILASLPAGTAVASLPDFDASGNYTGLIQVRSITTGAQTLKLSLSDVPDTYDTELNCSLPLTFYKASFILSPQSKTVTSRVGNFYILTAYCEGLMDLEVSLDTSKISNLHTMYLKDGAIYAFFAGVSYKYEYPLGKQEKKVKVPCGQTAILHENVENFQPTKSAVPRYYPEGPYQLTITGSWRNTKNNKIFDTESTAEESFTLSNTLPTLVATPATISSGGNTTLTWVAKEVLPDSCGIQSTTGVLPFAETPTYAAPGSAGSIVLTLVNTGTTPLVYKYILKCGFYTGAPAYSNQVSVTVDPVSQADSVRLYCDTMVIPSKKCTVQKNTSATVTWKSDGAVANTCKLKNSVTGSETSGLPTQATNYDVGSIEEDTTFTLSCQKQYANGQTSDKVDINVLDGSLLIYDEYTGAYKNGSVSLGYGKSTKLSWYSSHASSCVVNPMADTRFSATDVSTGPIVSSQNFDLYCSPESNSLVTAKIKLASVSVLISHLSNLRLTLTATPGTVPEGGVTNFRAESTFAIKTSSHCELYQKEISKGASVVGVETYTWMDNEINFYGPMNSAKTKVAMFGEPNTFYTIYQFVARCWLADPAMIPPFLISNPVTVMTYKGSNVSLPSNVVAANEVCNKVSIKVSKPALGTIQPDYYEIWRNETGFDDAAFDTYPWMRKHNGGDSFEEEYSAEAAPAEVEYGHTYFYAVKAHYTINGIGFTSLLQKADRPVKPLECVPELGSATDVDILKVNGKILSQKVGATNQILRSGADDFLACNKDSDGQMPGGNIFPYGATVTFRICVKNTGARSSESFIVLKDTLTLNLKDIQNITPGNGCTGHVVDITPLTPASTGFTYQFDTPAVLTPQKSCILTFDAKIGSVSKLPVNSCVRFNNSIQAYDGAIDIDKKLADADTKVLDPARPGPKVERLACDSASGVRKYEISP